MCFINTLNFNTNNNNVLLIHLDQWFSTFSTLHPLCRLFKSHLTPLYIKKIDELFFFLFAHFTDKLYNIQNDFIPDKDIIHPITGYYTFFIFYLNTNFTS